MRPEYLFDLIFFAGLVAGVYMDIRYREIYDFIWLICIASAIGKFIMKGPPDLTVLLSFSFYAAVQEIIMPGSYGKADCHAFCVIALRQAACGLELESYVLLMALTFINVLFSQAIDGNIMKNGRLKKPIPMIPYIFAGFIMEESLLDNMQFF